MFSIRLDASPVIRAVSAVYDRLRARIPRGVDLAAKSIAGRARSDHKYTDRTGALTRSIKATEVRGDFFSEGVFSDIEATAPHAASIEYGSRAHKIRAKRARALRFTGRNGGVRFAAEVNHPGTKPHRFLGDALDAELPSAVRLLEDEAVEAFHDAGFR